MEPQARTPDTGGSSPGRSVVVGVGGGIAAYKVAGLVRLFREGGHDVRVIPTDAALRFVGEPTWAALSGNPVSSRVWDDVANVRHVATGQNADLVVVAPATADLLARAAAGRADDLLTSTLLTARCPVVFAPAMHTEMWEHPATQANVATLRERGTIVIDPDSGRLTGADSGPGRLPDVASIHSVGMAALSRQRSGQDLRGLNLLITAGGTREPLDPVRYLGNRSSGRMGHAICAAAVARGGTVTVVSAHVSLPDPAGATVVPVSTAGQMRTQVTARRHDFDVIVMAAAVADFRPASVSDTKLKKGDASEPATVDLVRNPDILRELVDSARPDQTIVGFAAETGDDSATVLQMGQQKLARKRCDLLVVNDVSGDNAFGTTDNAVVVLSRDGRVAPYDRAPKESIANAILNEVLTARESVST